MSNLKTKRVQIGDHSTAANNFVMHQSDTPDGKVHISNGTLDSHTSKMTLAHDGKLGIGTTSPETDFHVQNSAGGGAIQIGRDTGADEYQYLNFGGNASGDDAWQIGKKDNSSDTLAPAKGFYVYDIANSASRLAINTSGRVSIGTTTALAKLHVADETVGTGRTDIRISRSVNSSAVNRKFALIMGTNAANLGSTWRMETESSTGYNDNATLNWIHNSAGTDKSPAMSISHNGYVTMDYQPSVNAYVQSSNLGAYNNASSNSVIVAAGIRHNIGGHYNTSNGRFTCPTSGRYFVSFSSNWYNINAGTWIRPQIRRNGAIHCQHYENTASNPTWIHIAASTVIDCSTGDYLEIYNNTQSGAGGGMDVNQYSNINFHKIA